MRRLNMAGLLAAALAMTGCSDSDTEVHVDVTGQVEGIFQLVVNISAGGLATKLYVPMVPRAITLPTSFSIEMDHSRQGQLTLDIAGNDENNVQIASGSGVLPVIDVGHLNPMTIELTAVTPPGGGQPDGGGGDDAGGADGGAGGGLDAAAELGGDDTGSADGGVAPETADDDAATDAGGDDVASDETGP